MGVYWLATLLFMFIIIIQLPPNSSSNYQFIGSRWLLHGDQGERL